MKLSSVISPSKERVRRSVTVTRQCLKGVVLVNNTKYSAFTVRVLMSVKIK